MYKTAPVTASDSPCKDWLKIVMLPVRNETIKFKNMSEILTTSEVRITERSLMGFRLFIIYIQLYQLRACLLIKCSNFCLCSVYRKLPIKISLVTHNNHN